MHLENVRFKSCPRTHEGGRQLLGYADVTLAVPGALPDGSDFLFTVTDIAVAVAANGNPVIDFKSRKAEVAGETRYFPYTFPRNAETRAWLTAMLHALPEVQRVLKAA